jgi:transcriptional regulator with PAS, ATPase and Fis domain
MLLRVLEERTFERLGGSKPISADVRVIVATNRDLQVAMRAGDFRPDLFYRLNAFPIEVPPLRERRDDIPMLVTHFIAVSAARHGRTIRNIEKRGVELLRSYDWPGNIRELRNVIDTSVIVANGEVLSIDEEQLFAARSSEDAPDGFTPKGRLRLTSGYSSNARWWKRKAKSTSHPARVRSSTFRQLPSPQR